MPTCCFTTKNMTIPQVGDRMQLVFDFFVGSMEELLVSPLRTFLTHLRMRMSLLLRTAVESTVKVRCY